MDMTLTPEESDQWDQLCNRLGIADDFGSTEVSFVLNYLRGNGQLRGLFDFADGKASAEEAEVARENEAKLWETWCLSVCKDRGVPVNTDLPSEAALVIERLAPTGQWIALAAGPIGSSMHKEWIALRLPKRLSADNKTEQTSVHLKMQSLFKSEQEAVAYKATHQLHGRVAEPVKGTGKWALNFPIEAHLIVNMKPHHVG